ncbi:MAG TPA: hypothetical protein VK996_13865 [Ramlibacter sp.]|nr:hypothetical protein [Ramlibacter sp.]
MKAGPTWFRRRPSLSQHPAGSQAVIVAGRGTETGGATVTVAGGAGAIAAAGMAGAGTDRTTSGAPERSALPLDAPRQAFAAAARAAASRGLRGWRAAAA